ncbi:MAG: LysR family transcriptional regulator [Desulfobacterota bacterium]|nr:LysR family transcriptional regulator [Thermodesulfobacteriota bacterium]MDW8001547.1 LysR family transcriptional regulator [Deltaproteobacteria bacterium]
MKALYRIWLDEGGKAFGEGPYNLLKHVEKTGSLSKAAKNMGISYRKAWQIIDNCEQRLGFKLLERKSGGKRGGGSSVTEKGKAFLIRYEKFREEVKNLVEEAFQRHFGSTLKKD